MQTEVLHELPGRIRIGCRALGFLGPQEAEITGELRAIDAVLDAQVSSITANALITYDPDEATRDDLVTWFESVMGVHSLTAYKAERAAEGSLTVNERRLQEEPLSEMASRVTVTAVSLGISWFKRHSARPPRGLLGRFLTMPALTSLSLAVPIFRSGLRSLRDDLRPNADTLSSTAILASLVAGRDVSALTIIWLADIAELLTAYSMNRARRAIRDMLSVGEPTARRLREDGTEDTVPIEVVVPEDRIVVRTGERIGVDGSVESGEAAVDQASITGEFLPMRKAVGDPVFAGTVLKAGRLVIRVEKVGDDTAVARIVHLVEEATHRKAAVQNIADRISAQFIPVNFLLALLVYLFTGKRGRALNMLIIDYSCGVRLSTATALSAAISTAARHGILVKGGSYLEILAEADTLVLDKTGTMTAGRPKVTSIVTIDDDIDDRRLLQLAAAAEDGSTHPLAVAILGKVRRQGLSVPRHSESRVWTALGVEATVRKSVIRAGSRRFMEQTGIDLSGCASAVSRLARQGENIVYVAKDDRLLGLLGIQDSLRENMKKALNRLRLAGMDDVILLTGDVEQHAEIVAQRMAMDSYRAEVLPDDKAETVLRLQSKGPRVVMVGDGINDAPALAYADVGIAMGGNRTDVAMEAADITIAGEDPLMIPGTVRMAQLTMQIIRQNFAVAIGVNTLGLVLASIGVLPVFWAAVLHNACTVAVVGNSSRLLFHDVERDR